MEMKRHVKLPKKSCKLYQKKMCNGNEKACKITEKMLQDINDKF